MLHFRYLIQFTKNKEEYEWRGYLYAALLMVTALLQSLVLHQYFHSCLVLGMRLRSVIISAVYRKVPCPQGPPQTYTTATALWRAAANQQDFVEFSMCARSKPHHKARLGCGAATGDVCGTGRTSPVLCSVWLCCSPSQLRQQRSRLLTKWWTAQSSLIEKWRDKLACIKSEKSSRIYTSMYQSV